MKRLLLLTSFFFLTSTLLIFSLFFLSFLSFEKNPHLILSSKTSPKNVAFAALPSIQNTSVGEIIQSDAREEMLRQFFQKYGSVLEPYAHRIVMDADVYGLDFRLLPSIAMQESNLCSKSPEDWHNCWGYGIYGKTVTTFANYDDAIDAVTKGLAKYKKSGLDTPEEIMSRYTPQSNGSWAHGVTHFMDQLQ